MKQVKNRTLIVWLLVLGLIAGVVFFLFEYATQGLMWANFGANAQAFSGGSLSNGQILDRNGVLLYNASTKEYAEDKIVRKSTLHAVGDPDNNISTSAKYALRDHLIGYNVLTGTTSGGNMLYLTIDSELNTIAYNALDGRKGTVAVYNYETGEILCMVSNPSFDPANVPSISDGDSRYEGVYLNRFLSSTFTPGSIFKVITTAASIDQIPDLFSRSFTCTGSIVVGNTEITCPKKHGEMDIYSALANSCNCAYAELATELGGDVLYEYCEKAGLLSSLDVSGISTAQGSYTIASDEELAWSGVGQFQDMVNPCSYLAFMGAIANNGTMVTPRLISKETTMKGMTVSTEKPTTSSFSISQKTCATLKDMLRNNVIATYGQSNFGDLAICAKSGTAEVGDGTSHAWFSGFLDDSEHPYAFVVLVENGGGGASVAGTIASKVLQAATQE